MSATLLWFRQDLRVEDNPALGAARGRGGQVIPVYIWDPKAEGDWAPGGASRWWLHHSLKDLDASLRQLGSRLWLFEGDTRKILASLCERTKAGAVYWNRRYEPSAIARDSAVKAALTRAGVEARSFNGALLFEPHTIANKQGGPFQVFTPYWRRCLELPVAAPVKSRGPIDSPARVDGSVPLESLALLPSIPWDKGFPVAWSPGETGARERLRAFVGKGLQAYDGERDLPSADGTSRLSAFLHFGNAGPRQVWAAVQRVGARSGVFPAHAGAAVFLKELGWREFAHHLLYHFPTTPDAPLREAFARFPWADDPGRRKLSAWEKGLTGYPIVDAGMRQLWATGWMHNRVRMIVASFLVKHLRLPWQRGAAWFWDTLLDADLANNTLGWQWSAGCGADAAPYFRIFAPVLQGKKFDPEGRFVRTWIPELSRLPDAFLQAPWEAPAEVLAKAGVRLGITYPQPIVDHAQARADALKAFRVLRSPSVQTP